jgi:hypothetical protein
MKKFILALTYTLATLFSTPGLTAERISTADLIEGISTSKNFLKDKGHFEKNANGFSSYADAAAASPVDGTGGSATNTCTRTTSSPLAGDGSFLITHAGTNRQGDGCSASFSIDSSAKGKALQIKFDYAVASGTMSDTDQSVWVYDVTNSRLIQPAGSAILNSGIIESKTLSFQSSSDSTSYRLIFHTSSTSTTSYTLKIDDIIVRPIVAVSGASVTDWQTFTPTGGWTNTTYTGQWRRVGDSMEVRATATLTGTPVGTLSITIPNSQAIDTTKVEAGVPIGQLRWYDSGTTGVMTGSMVINGSTAVTPTGQRFAAAGNNDLLSFTPSALKTFASGDLVLMEFKVPIVGWGSNQVLSSDTDTRIVSAVFSLDSSQTGVNPNNSDVKINLSKVLNDTHGGIVTASGKYIVKVPGTYDVSARVALQTPNVIAGAEYRLVIYKNGADAGRGQSYIGVSATAANLTVSTLLYNLVAGDYIELYLYGSGNNSASTLTVYGDASSPAYTSMSMYRLAGPSQIAASESVIASYQVGSGQSLTSTGIIKADTKLIDTHNAYSTSTGIFTAPISGSYRVSGALFSNTATSNWEVSVRKNSGNIIRCNISPVYSGGTTSVNNDSVCAFPGVTISMKAGDTLDIYNITAVGVGTLYASTLDNWILIERVGY